MGVRSCPLFVIKQITPNYIFKQVSHVSRCMVPLSQDAAYDVLLEICNHNCDGLKAVADKLITWHHSSVGTSEWEYMPPVEGRASSGLSMYKE